MITMPDTAYVSIFMDNDLTHITEDHFKIKLIARLLDQMHVVQPPMFPPRYDDTPPSAPRVFDKQTIKGDSSMIISSEKFDLLTGQLIEAQ